MRFLFQGPSGKLEAILERPDGTDNPRAAAIVCHPHPKHGGTMKNTVVYRTARALRTAGLVTLRFNFRGVEGSTGVHHGDDGEEHDAYEALRWLAHEYPGCELWAAGFSFGARTVAGLAEWQERVARVICIALPVKIYEISGFDRIDQPVYCLFGGKDEFGTLADLNARYPDLPENFELDEIEGADHFFRGRTPLVEERVLGYARRALEQS
jgi:hypothetical protein